ncbi:MAG: PIN domain-containing protein, partial [candidate division Zixibacteria bacterium]|nr:PIN domain-containing protein [candidate division Zixibacteria bacterium]
MILHIRYCKIIDINTNIKSEVIKIRRKYKIKLPDCIIIATSI